MATTPPGPSSNAFGATLADPVMLRHANRLILLAREAKAACNSLYFIVFDEQQTVDTPDWQAWNGWYRFDFDLGTTTTVAGNVKFEKQLPPPELRLGGMDLITLPVTAQPFGGGDFAFRAYSDGQAIAVYRVSSRRSLLLDRLTLIESTVEGQQGAEARFALQVSWETRFKYSGIKDVPDDDLDSLAYQDALGQPFIEPTLELPRIDPGAAGLFDVAEVPTGNADLKAIYIAISTGSAFALHRIERHADGFLDFSGDSEVLGPVLPLLDPGSVPLAPLAGMAPAVAYYGEQDPARSASGQEVELQRLGRLALAMPVSGGGLAAAMAVFDYALDGTGRIANLAPADQTAPLVDGTLSGSTFTPDTTSPVFPTALNIAAATGLKVSKMVLGQVQPHGTPLLYMGDDGLLHLYYGGPLPTSVNGVIDHLNPNQPQAMVAQYDTRVTRLVLAAPWTLSQPSEEPAGKVYFNALLGGPVQAGSTVAITKTTFTASGPTDLRDLKITYPAGLHLPAETWVGVPADVTQFADVLNGEATSDSADPAAKRGTRTFFDYGGKQTIVRVPVTSAAGETPALQFVSSLPDVALSSLTISKTGSTLSFAFAGQTKGQHPIAVTWAQVPAALSAYGDIFAGVAGPTAYTYPADSSATPLWALATTGEQSFAPVLFCATSAAVAAAMTLSVTPVGNGQVTFVVHGAPGGKVVIADIPAEVAGFVAALEGDSKFTALGLEILAGSAAGQVAPTDAPQPRCSLADTSVLFDLLLPAVALELFTPTPASYTAGQQGHSYVTPSPALPETTMAGFVISYDVPSAGIVATVDRASAKPTVNRTVHLTGAPDLHGALWLRQAPVMACTFTASDNVVIPIQSGLTPLPYADNLQPQPRWTLETWFKPVGSSQQQLISFRDTSKVLPAGAPKLEYALGVKGQKVVALPSYSNFNGNDSSYFHTKISPTASFFPEREFTWECWLQPQAAAAPSGTSPVPVGVILQYGATPFAPQFAVGLDAARHVHIQVPSTFSGITDYATTAAVPAVDASNNPVWSHLALIGTQDLVSGTWSITVVLNGEPLQTFTGITIKAGQPPALSIGGSSLNNSSLFGQLAQLRLWNFARSLSELRRTALITLTGGEFGLLGSWPMGILVNSGSGQVLRNDAQASGAFWDAELFNKPKQPVTMVEDSFFLSVLATVGGMPPREVPAMLRNGTWNHVALSYEAGGALELNPTKRFAAGVYDWMEIEQSQSLDAGQKFAIDAWVIVPKTNNLPGTIIARWAQGTDLENSGYRLQVERDGKLTFEIAYVADLKGTMTSAKLTTTTLAVADGLPHHIAAVFSSTEQEQKPGGGTIDPTLTLTIWVDDVAQASTPLSVAELTRIQVNNPERPVLVGRGFLPPPTAEPAADESILFFQGTIGEMRFWNTAPSEQALFPERYPRIPRVGLPKGLAARWSFSERAGFIAKDDVGDADGQLSTSAMWSPFEATSAMRIYANGGLIGASEVFSGTFNAGTTDQLTFGAAGSVAGITGQLARVSLYDTARAGGTIEAQKYVPSTGAERNLTACWDFSGGGRDITDGTNNPVPPIAAARLAASDAPISNEGPYVLNAYGGLSNDASMCTPGRIAVGNYVGVIAPATNAQQAVLKRQFVMEPGQTFTTGIQIGELDLTFVGQVQTEPTLIGYIEGAPPVPSENLTRPFYKSPTTTQYFNASSVTLVQDTASEVTFTSVSAAATQVDFSAAIGLMTVANISVSAGTGFYNINNNMLNFENKLQAQMKVSSDTGTSETTGYAGNWLTRQSYTMALTGDWEEAPYLNPAVGRRYVAANLGYALVESLTADLYTMRFRSTGASLGTIVLPNPDIPPDRNIILFPLKATDYTKASTLDGKVGLVNDPDFRDADIRRGSYYQPVEAYATQSQIEFQEQRARTYAASFKAQAKGQAKDADISGAAKNLPAKPDNDGDQEEQALGTLAAMIPAQGIVCKTVWTSEGGYYSEQHSYGAKASKAFSGYYKVGGGAGIKGDGKFLLKFGFAWSLDLLASHSTRVDTSNTLANSAAMALTVTVGGESNLKVWDDQKQSFSAQPGPGKVRAYRLSTFYLPPSVKNGTKFDEIVDPVWKRLSSDPMARALRELRITNPVWRVFHRTTYVERQPPPAATGPNFAPPAIIRPPVNITGNLDLCRLVDQELGKLGQRHDRLSVAEAIAAVINPPPTAPGVYPPAVLEQDFAWWKDFLTSARPDAQGKIASAANARVLADVQSRTVSYIYAGYATGAIQQALKES